MQNFFDCSKPLNLPRSKFIKVSDAPIWLGLRRAKHMGASVGEELTFDLDLMLDLFCRRRRSSGGKRPRESWRKTKRKSRNSRRKW